MALWFVFAVALLLSAVAGFVLGLSNRWRLEILDRRFLRLLSQLSERLANLENSLVPVAPGGLSPGGELLPHVESAPPPRPAEPRELTPPAAAPAAPLATPASSSPTVPLTTPAPSPIPVPASSSIAAPLPGLRFTPVPAPAPAGGSGGGRSASPPPRPPRPSLPSIDWEGLVGVKMFSWIAGIALVFAAVFFLRYSIEHGWLSPAIRMAIGLVTGAGLLVGCELRAARRYPVTASALDGAGISILFSTLFASYSLWKLLPQPAVFAAMALVAALAVLLSIRRNSLFIALLGLVGAFATPILLSTGEDRPFALFSYLMVLDVGLSWVAYRKRWPVLVALSVGFTTVYQWGWTLRFLDPGRLPLAITIFAAFATLHVLAFVRGARRGAEADEDDQRLGKTASAAALVPAAFAIYVAAVPAYGNQHGLLFLLISMVAVGLGIAAKLLRREELHLAGASATVGGLAVWLGVSYESAAWPASLAFLAAMVGWYLAGPWLSRRLGGSESAESRLATLAAPALLLAFPVFAAIEPAVASPGLLFGGLFAMLAAIAVVAVARRETALYVLASLAALATEAVWSLHYLTPERLLAGLAVYVGFALFHLGVPIAASRSGKPLDPAAGGFLTIGGIALLFFFATGPVAPGALWALALLVGILNAGLFLQEESPARTTLTRAGVALSWVVIASWWQAAIGSPVVVPALAMVAAFALLVTAGGVWNSRRTGASLGRGTELALVAHGFLFFVATRPELSVPPWPMLGVLLVVDLAIGAASLLVRNGAIFAAAIVASQGVLLAWSGVEIGDPWSLTAVLAAGSVAALGLAWIPLAKRRGAVDDFFFGAAALGVVLAQLVTILAASVGVGVGLGWLVPIHVLLLAGLLWVAWKSRWPLMAVGAVLPSMVAAAAWILDAANAAAWQGALAFCGAIYAVFLAYPIALGRRARTEIDPYLAATVAGVPALLLARHALVASGLESWVGLVPVIQAVGMLALLGRALALEPSRETPVVPAAARSSGRIALLAGGALAFVTVAIPLQLSREWITVSWALESAALAWLHRRIRFPQLVWWSAGLAAAAFVRLALNPAVLSYHPASATPIWNWYLYTYLVPAMAMFASASWLRTAGDRFLPGALRASDVLTGGATVLLFLLLNIEIADFYSTGQALTFHFSGDLAQDLTYTIGWGLFAIGVLAAGIVRRSRVARVAALSLLVTTIAKCFAYDLWRLGGLYRVGSFVGLAVCLALVAILLQRFVFGAEEERS